MISPNMLRHNIIRDHSLTAPAPRCRAHTRFAGRRPRAASQLRELGSWCDGHAGQAKAAATAHAAAADNFERAKAAIPTRREIEQAQQQVTAAERARRSTPATPRPSPTSSTASRTRRTSPHRLHPLPNVARYGADVVNRPSRATAYRILEQLENRHPTFRLSTKKNRDIAERPNGVYGKLRPTQPGEYLLMDTTSLDVFALDPVTLRWVQAELTAGMDWYTRCVTGIRVTPVSTKSVDAASVLYQAYRPRPAGKNWPVHAVWPEHGIPRSVLIDVDAVEGPLIGTAGPAIVPETVVVDHGKIYVSEHLTSVCERLGVSIQSARLRTGRDKGRQCPQTEVICATWLRTRSLRGVHQPTHPAQPGWAHGRLSRFQQLGKVSIAAVTMSPATLLSIPQRCASRSHRAPKSFAVICRF
jgi:hypothetical protein